MGFDCAARLSGHNSLAKMDRRQGWDGTQRVIGTGTHEASNARFNQEMRRKLNWDGIEFRFAQRATKRGHHQATKETKTTESGDRLDDRDWDGTRNDGTGGDSTPLECCGRDGITEPPPTIEQPAHGTGLIYRTLPGRKRPTGRWDGTRSGGVPTNDQDRRQIGSCRRAQPDRPNGGRANSEPRRTATFPTASRDARVQGRAPG